jgi:hypothetical protein
LNESIIVNNFFSLYKVEPTFVSWYDVYSKQPTHSVADLDYRVGWDFQRQEEGQTGFPLSLSFYRPIIADEAIISMKNFSHILLLPLKV